MEKIKMLFVDDEADFIDTVVKRVKRRNFLAFGVDRGQKALDTLDKERFDVVILDMMMPDMDGLATLKEIKKRHPLVEVIMLTGHGSVESGIQGMSLGAYDYVMKPVDIDVLLDKARQAYERKMINEGKNI